MRRRVSIVTLATCAAAAAVAAGAIAATVDPAVLQSAVDAAQAVDPTLAAPANDGQHDFAVGGFQTADTTTWGVSGQSGPNGENPFGHVSFTSPSGFKGRYDVVCLAVAGNDAALGLVPTPTTGTGPGGVLALHDGGPAAASADRYTFNQFESPLTCAAHVGEAVLVPVNGNIVVNDS